MLVLKVKRNSIQKKDDQSFMCQVSKKNQNFSNTYIIPQLQEVLTDDALPVLALLPVQVVSLLLPDLLAPGASVYDIDMGQEKAPPMLTTDQSCPPRCSYH